MPIPPPDGNRSFFQVLRLTIKTGQEAQKDLSQLSMEAADNSDKTPTAYLVDLVSNRKIPIPTPSCKVGRDDDWSLGVTFLHKGPQKRQLTREQRLLRPLQVDSVKK